MTVMNQFQKMTAPSHFNHVSTASPRLGSVSPPNIANDILLGNSNGSIGGYLPSSSNTGMSAEALLMNHKASTDISSFSTTTPTSSGAAATNAMGLHDLKTYQQLFQGHRTTDTFTNPMVHSFLETQGPMSMPSSSATSFDSSSLLHPSVGGLTGSSAFGTSNGMGASAQSNDFESLKSTYLLQQQLMMNQNQNQMPSSMHLGATSNSLLSGSSGLRNGLTYPGSSGMNPMQSLPSPHSLFNRDGTQRKRGGVIEPFPEKLHRLLVEVEAAGRTDVISFIAGGHAFAIHKADLFFKEIVPLYFRQSRLSSFKRQLNLYGFELINSGPSRGGYRHELFRRDQPDLCRKMRRVMATNSQQRKAASSDSQKKEEKYNGSLSPTNEEGSLSLLETQ